MREMFATWKISIHCITEQSVKLYQKRHPKNKIGKGYEQAVQSIKSGKWGSSSLTEKQIKIRSHIWLTKTKQCSRTLWDKHPCSYTPIYLLKTNHQKYIKELERVNIVPDSEYHQKDKAKFTGTLEDLIAERGKIKQI